MTKRKDILIDGSNVLFWRGGVANAEVPLLIVKALYARRFAPQVYFDNTIAQFLDLEALEAIAPYGSVTIMPRGRSADVSLLDRCQGGRLQIVTCDQFRDWRGTYPDLKADWRVSGRVEKGSCVQFSKKLRHAPL